MRIEAIIMTLSCLFMGSLSYGQTGQLTLRHDSTHFYSGKEGKVRHTLTFQSDSTFHITVPNNSGSCWTRDKFFGRMEIHRDTVIFYLRGYEDVNGRLVNKEEKELFIAKGDRILKRQSPEKVMFKTYKLKRW